jgi:hypothetical protein
MGLWVQSFSRPHIIKTQCLAKHKTNPIANLISDDLLTLTPMV